MSESFETTFDTPEPIELHVENGRGHIDVTATDTAGTSVRITGDRADEFDVRHLEGRVEVIPPRRDGGLFGRNHRAEIVVVVPAGSGLVARSGSSTVSTHGRLGAARIDSGSGDLTVELVEGPTQVRSGSGDVAAEHLAGDSQVKSGSGDVRLRRVDGDLMVTTGSGDVVVGATAAKVAFKTGSGDVQVASLADDLVYTTGSGDLDVKSAAAGRISAKTASGDVSLGVVAGTPVWTDIRTASGRLHSELPTTGEPADGQPFLEVRVTTASGDVTLHQG